MPSNHNPLRLGSIVSDFEIETTDSRIKFHDFIGSSWLTLFSHLADFTPVWINDLGVVVLSVDGLEFHHDWIKDINEINNVNLKVLIADADRKIPTLHDTLDYQDITNIDSKDAPFTVRSVFFIAPKKTIRLALLYPASTGRNFDKTFCVVDSLQLGDKDRITTPANWKGDDNIIVHPSVINKKAEKLFPGFKTVKLYLRFAAQSGAEKT
ncbi:hypothetical protein BGZ51_002541 [Haplosporangium sp. Z 767]|nr:hypothetical protein BGZ50_006068 [Haplosporangium sp. Z 11]KAF9185604.1 hypothetical protein BGZ51_002541 [Haplosporangium sp. Z 767]